MPGNSVLVVNVSVARGDEYHDISRPPAAALTFRNLCYDVPDEKTGGQLKRLLNGVSGIVRGGSLTILMGASGAGKTTLIDVLAGRKTTGTVSGEIKLNGRPLPPGGGFARFSSYVEQFDLLFPTMTVREAVVLSAMVRLDNSVPRHEKLAAAEWALRELDLEAAAGLVIGTLAGGGIPVETAAGRSARRSEGQTALRITNKLGMASSPPPASEREASEAGAPAPTTAVLSRTRMNRAADEIAAQFQASALARTLQEQISELEAALSAKEAPRVPQRPGFGRQVALLIDRKARWLWRERQRFWVSVARFQMGEDQPSARLRLSAMYCMTLYFYFRALGDITSHCSLRDVYYRERAQGVSNLVVLSAFHIVNAVACIAIVYPLCGFRIQGHMGYAVLMACVWTLVNSSFIEFLALALPVRDPPLRRGASFQLVVMLVVQIAPVVFAIASAVLACGAFFAGFMIPGPDIPRAWIWFFYLHWFRYPFEGLATNELSNIVFKGCSPQMASTELCFPTGAAVLARYDLNPDRQWANLGILAAYWVAFEAGKALALHRITHLRR
eukprot:tig00000158_g10192.t1